MTVLSLFLKGMTTQFHPVLRFCGPKSMTIGLKQFPMNFSCFLMYPRAYPGFQITNDLRFYTSRLKCCNLIWLRMQTNSLRTGLKWGKCTTSKILSKHNYKRNQRCRNIQSLENVTQDGLIHVASLKETRRKVAKRMEQIKENVLTIPNALCLVRIAATPFLGYLVLQEFYATSLGIFVLAGITDVADGYVARTFPSQQSMIGSFLDPAADKILVATLFLCLTANGLIPVPLTSLIILRDACLMSAGFYIRYVSLPPPKTLTRYFDLTFATARLSPTTISKANTLVQLSLVAASLAAPVFGFVDHLLLQSLWYIVGTTTVLSAGSYLYCKNTYKLLAMNRTKSLSNGSKY